jgi:hypothetical protein
MRHRALVLFVAFAVGGAAGPVDGTASAQAAPPPSTNLSILPSASLVLRAAADVSGVYAYTYEVDREERRLVRRRHDGTIDALASALRIEQLALDEDRVYWVGQDGVQAIAKHGGPVQTLAGRDASLIAGNTNPARWAIVVDGDDVYFSLDDGVGRVDRYGGPSQLLAGGEGAMLVGVDAAEVSWLEPEHDGTWDLVATPRRGGPSRRVLAGLPSVMTMVLDEEGIYWLAATERPGIGAIHRASRDGSAPATLDADVPLYYEHVLALGGPALFWLEYPSGLHGPMRVRAMVKGGGTPVTLAESFPPANKIFVDDHRVYWAQEGIRAITRPGT